MSDTNGNGKMLTPWKATAKQLSMFEAAQELGFDKNITSICEKAGVSRTIFYKWMQEDAEFKREWCQRPFKLLGVHIPGVLAALVHRANLGDLDAINRFLELIGMSAAGQQAITNVVLNLNQQNNTNEIQMGNINTEDREFVQALTTLCGKIAGGKAGPNGAGNGSQ